MQTPGTLDGHTRAVYIGSRSNAILADFSRNWLRSCDRMDTNIYQIPAKG
uniref:Uncharacterized protein n=1 Tax=Anopheles atroparvus TaxID=41427 RepID=A0AAG5CZ02_ANOAO